MGKEVKGRGREVEGRGGEVEGRGREVEGWGGGGEGSEMRGMGLSGCKRWGGDELISLTYSLCVISSSLWRTRRILLFSFLTAGCQSKESTLPQLQKLFLCKKKVAACRTTRS